MKFTRFKISIISILFIVLVTTSINYSYAQIMQDNTCPSCVQISDTKSLEIHKTMTFPIILWADNFMYTFDHDSMITINGHSNLNSPDTPIIITVTDPIGNLVTVQQLMIPQNSDFKVNLNTAGDLWKKDGMFVIKAQGGPSSTIFKTNVELISIGLGTTTECSSNEIISIADNGGQYCIPFSSSGAITGIGGTINAESKSLTINVRGLDIQTLILEIERSVLNSQSNGQDDSFVVLLNGQEAEFDEQESDLANHRNLAISIPPGESNIEIIGTSAIPEFGTIAVLILVVSVITGVVLTSGRFQISNTFQKLQ